MKRIELITSKEYWVETLEALQQLGHSDYEIATVIANKMTEAMNYIPCCKSDSELLCKCTTRILENGNIQLRMCKKCAKEEGLA